MKNKTPGIYFITERPLLTYTKIYDQGKVITKQGRSFFKQPETGIQNIPTEETTTSAWLDVLLSNFLS